MGKCICMDIGIKRSYITAENIIQGLMGCRVMVDCETRLCFNPNIHDKCKQPNKNVASKILSDFHTTPKSYVYIVPKITHQFLREKVRVTSYTVHMWCFKCL